MKDMLTETIQAIARQQNERRNHGPRAKALRQLICAGNLLGIALETGSKEAGERALEAWEAAVKRVRELSA